MSGDKETQAERQARLAKALRENLRKRKGQARARAGENRPEEAQSQEGGGYAADLGKTTGAAADSARES